MLKSIRNIFHSKSSNGINEGFILLCFNNFKLVENVNFTNIQNLFENEKNSLLRAGYGLSFDAVQARSQRPAVRLLPGP